MIEIDEALGLILSRCQTLPTERRSAVDSVGYVLAEGIAADVDSPPHDKALVDGYAIRCDDAGNDLRLLEQVVAGAVPTHAIESGTTSHVMTGAPIPQGTEAMVMLEDVQQIGETIRVPRYVLAGQHIMRRATTFAQDEVLLTSGTTIRPITVGLLCEVGRPEVLCIRKPTIAVLPTGDELVEPNKIPSAGQIRNSNGPMLAACATSAGCDVVTLDVGRDKELELRRQIERGLAADILLLSGGVSAGVRDLVPPTLKLLGVEEVFHKVRLKPGKPIWFGRCAATSAADRETLVFGLPGNPVSALVCFKVFVEPAIHALRGLASREDTLAVRLATKFQHRGNRPTYFPATLVRENGRLHATPLPWLGSADMLTVSRADCLILFAAGDRDYNVGEELTALPIGN